MHWYVIRFGTTRFVVSRDVVRSIGLIDAFETQPKLVVDFVVLQNIHKEFVSNLHNIARMVDKALIHFGNVQQSTIG